MCFFPFLFSTRPVDGKSYTDYVYGKPYCRIAPYLVGIGLGYIMYRTGKRKVKMSPVRVWLQLFVCWGVCLLCWICFALFCVLYVKFPQSSCKKNILLSIRAEIFFQSSLFNLSKVYLKRKFNLQTKNCSLPSPSQVIK